MADPNWKDIGRDVLQKYLNAEKGGSGGDAGQFGIDIFNNGFEDEFPGDNDDPASGTYQGYSLEANRASENRPWGGKFGDRPKIHELNQPEAAQALGWRVVDFYPNRDFKSEFYRLAGTPAELRQMMQIVQATRFVTGARVNFEAWFEQWEKGFPDFKEERNGNFSLTGDKQWERIKKPETRPRFREWTNSQQRADYGFRVIEYWRDRSAEFNSIILSGTDLQLIQHIIQIEYEGGGLTSTKGKGGNLPYLKGQPLITLEFVQDPDKVGVNSNGNLISPVTGTITFRIMDKTDDPKSHLEKISKTDLKNYAKRISEEFGANGCHVWEKGKAVLSYRNRKQGFESWYLVRNKKSGITLVEKLLAITGKKIETTCIKFSETENASDAYPEMPDKATILGEEIELARERPVVDVRFREASIHLPRSRKTIQLVLFANVVYK
jgi:hypothetical protein